MIPLRILLASFLGTFALHAQSATGGESLLTTVGTTVEDGAGHSAYLLWQPEAAAATFGKRFGVYRKSGAADAPGNYQRVGIQTLQTSANTVRAMLALGDRIDTAASAAPTRIDGLYRDVTYAQGEPAVPAGDTAEKLTYLIQSAVTEPRTLTRLFFLGRAHPGVMLALGHAFHLPVAAGVHTFEIRELDLSDGDIRVVGRVTLDTAAPVIPAAPAAPVPVAHPVNADSQYLVNPKDHLNVRFRWGMGDDLRRDLPHTFGFDVFRVGKTVADNLGWNATPPSPAAMLSALAATAPDDPFPEISRANGLPILVGDILTPAQAADPADTERIDFSSDAVFYAGPDGTELRREYSDGESYYFFVAARTITGAPGAISPGTLVTFCDRLPPMPPVVDSVMSEYVAPPDFVGPNAQGGDQFLRVKIRQLPSTNPAEAATGYHIYRWENPQQYLASLGNPNLNRIGYVAHDPAETFVFFDDNGTGAPSNATHLDRSVWYTARAVGSSACADQEVWSGQSAPVPGFLRDFEAPDAPTGDFVVCRYTPSAQFISRTPTNPVSLDLPSDTTGIGVNLTRASPMIAAARIKVEALRPGGGFVTLYTRRHEFRGANSFRVDLPFQETMIEPRTILVRVSAITTTGVESADATRGLFINTPAPYAVYQFNLNAAIDCASVNSPAFSRPIHEPYNGLRLLNPIIGSISFPPGQGVKEWRVYRRVGNDGPLTLIAKAEGDAIPNPGAWQDDGLPSAAGASICYYGMVLDQNANASPLQRLGCVELAHDLLPVPMLSKSQVTGVNADDLVEVDLEWFCDPVGVERFEVLVGRQGGGVPEIGGLTPLPNLEPVDIAGSDFPDLIYHRFQTTPVRGVIMGSGPAFTATVTMPADAAHVFHIRAVGIGTPESRAVGPVSNGSIAQFIGEPDPVQPIIPWPARPLPPVQGPGRPIDAYQTGDGPLWATAFEDGISPSAPAIGVLIGATRDGVLNDSANGNAILDTKLPIEDMIFRTPTVEGQPASAESLLPFMLYRYQEPSDLFPRAVRNIVQVTPLIDRISYGNSVTGVLVSDPYLYFFGTDFDPATPPIPPSPLIPSGGTWSETSLPDLLPVHEITAKPNYLADATALIFVRDRLPVTVGARYRYLLARYDSRGEISQVIPLNVVQP